MASRSLTNNNNKHPSFKAEKNDLPLIGLALLDSALLRRQNKILQTRNFFLSLKSYTQTSKSRPQFEEEDDCIDDCSEIGPLTRNSEPNATGIFTKSIHPPTSSNTINQSLRKMLSSQVTSENLTRMVQQFSQRCRSGQIQSEELLRDYKVRMNQVEKMVLELKHDKQLLQIREADLVEKLKSLKFRQISTNEESTQTEVRLEELIKKEIELKNREYELETSHQEKMTGIQYKEQYLDYIEDTLTRKEEELANREREIDTLQNKLAQEEFRLKSEPLNHLFDAKSLYEYFALLKDRIYEAAAEYDISGNAEGLQLLGNHPLYELFEDYNQHNKNPQQKLQILRLLQVNILEIRYKLGIVEQYFNQEFEKACQMRKSLEQMHMKFSELNSYEQYLDKYRKMLEEKEAKTKTDRQLFNREMTLISKYLLFKAEDQASSTFNAGEEAHMISFSMDSNLMNPNSLLMLKQIEKEQPKTSRPRIFQLKKQAATLISQYSQIGSENTNNQHLISNSGYGSIQQEKQYMSTKINQLKKEFTRRLDLDSQQTERISRLQAENEYLKKQLAKYMRNEKSKGNTGQNVSQERTSITIREGKSLMANSQMHEGETFQSHGQVSNLDQILEESKRKKLIVKYLGKWLELSMHKNIKNNQMAKRFGLMTWRIRQYDPEIFSKIVDLTSENYEPYIQRLWESKCIKEKKEKLFPYKSLSLKRKQFLEEFFDFQRKQFFKNRVKSLMRSICKNKIRKERLILVVAFHRFVRNCALSANPLVPQNHHKQQLTQKRTSDLTPVRKNFTSSGATSNTTKGNVASNTTTVLRQITASESNVATSTHKNNNHDSQSFSQKKSSKASSRMNLDYSKEQYAPSVSSEAVTSKSPVPKPRNPVSMNRNSSTSSTTNIKDVNSSMIHSNHTSISNLQQQMENQRVQMQNRLRKVLACTKIIGLLMQKESVEEGRKGCAIWRWRNHNWVCRVKGEMRKMESRMEQVEFRASTESTKYRMAHSLLNSKITTLEELLSYLIPS